MTEIIKYRHFAYNTLSKKYNNKKISKKIKMQKNRNIRDEAYASFKAETMFSLSSNLILSPISGFMLIIPL